MQEMQETRVQFLSQADALEYEMATHSSISCLENSMDRRTWRYSPWGLKKSDMTELTHASSFYPWKSEVQGN